MNRNTADNTTVTEIENLLSSYDVVTFDIFDTLITRCVLYPSDVFSLVEAQAKHTGIAAKDFALLRQEAEQLAYRKFGETATYVQIYDVLKEHGSYSEEQCAALMELELDTEVRLAVPRIAVRDLLLKLRKSGKRIILCSDMYLSSQAIRRLLEKCGYPGDLELWVSCEKQASKMSGELWTQLLAQLPEGKRMIHMGDNQQGDYLNLKQLKKEAILISSGLSLFETSPLYDYLSPYITDSLGNRLLLGYLVNQACFNSPFPSHGCDREIAAIWCGGIFAAFMEYLSEQAKDGQLLFVTREGYLLKPMYERYCHALGKPPFPGIVFYASRAATLAASVRETNDIQTVMASRYQGTLGHFLKSRVNYELSSDSQLQDLPVHFPEDCKKVMQLLAPYFEEILENSRIQRDAYLSYISEVTLPNQKLTVVDIGCNGTIQYGLSRILEKPVSGIYIFMNEGTPAARYGCNCLGLRNPRSGIHPVYENQLFLEAAMQAPYGQLEKMVLENNRAIPKCRSDASISPYIPNVQEAFCGFTEWVGTWKKAAGNELKLDFELAEAVWISLLKFRYLPKELEDAFWLADDYSGNPVWRYDAAQQVWQGSVMEAPLVFSLQKAGTKLSLKQRIKNYIKAHIPYFAYNWAQKIWLKYMR